MSSSRRRFVLALGAAGGAAVAAGSWLAWRRGRSAELDAGSARFRALLEDLLGAPQSDVLERAARHVEQGVPVDWLLAAAFFGPIVRDANHDDVHAQLLVPAARSLWRSEALPERWLPVFFSVDYTNSWVRIAGASPWWTPARPGGSQGADEELRRALLAHDADGAERAGLALHRSRGADAVLGELLASSLVILDDPHRALYVAQAMRARTAFGSGLGGEVIASLCRWVARGGPAGQGGEPPGESFQRLQRAPRIAPPGSRPYDVSAAIDLANGMRQGPHPAAVEAALDLLRSGLPDSVLWDAVALAALDAAGVDPRGTTAGLHLVTLTTALRWCWNNAPLPPETRRQLLLQSVAWVASRQAELPPGTAGIALVPGGAGAPSSTRREFLRRGIELHQFKLIAALEEQATLVDPRLRDLVVDGTVRLIPPDHRWERHAEAMALAERLSRRA
jgi:hypothetical protein